MPVVDVLADQFVTGGGDVFAQQRQLRTDGATVGLRARSIPAHITPPSPQAPAR